MGCLKLTYGKEEVQLNVVRGDFFGEGKSGAGSYRYGFNGKEKDDEIKGSGASYDYGFRIYDPRLGRFLSVDPLSPDYPELTPYQFASNSPIAGIDIDGLEFGWANDLLKSAQSGYNTVVKVADEYTTAAKVITTQKYEEAKKVVATKYEEGKKAVVKGYKTANKWVGDTEASLHGNAKAMFGIQLWCDDCETIENEKDEPAPGATVKQVDGSLINAMKATVPGTVPIVTNANIDQRGSGNTITKMEAVYDATKEVVDKISEVVTEFGVQRTGNGSAPDTIYYFQQSSQNSETIPTDTVLIIK